MVENIKVVANNRKAGFEYFLLENRQRDFTGDSLRAVARDRGVILEVDDYVADLLREQLAS